MLQRREPSSSGIPDPMGGFAAPASLMHSWWAPFPHPPPPQAGGRFRCQVWTGHASLCCHCPSISRSALQLTPGMSHSDIWGYRGQVKQGRGQELGFHSQVRVRPNSTHDGVSSLHRELVWIRTVCSSPMITWVWSGLIWQDVLPGTSQGPGWGLRGQGWAEASGNVLSSFALSSDLLLARACWHLSRLYLCK